MKVAISTVMLLAAASLFGCSSDNTDLAKAKTEADAARAELAKVKAEADAAKTELATLKAQLAVLEAKIKEHDEAHGGDLIVSRSAKRPGVPNFVDEELGNKIKNLPGVRNVQAVLYDLISYPENAIPIVYLFGLEPSTVKLKLKQGRRLTHEDKHKVAIGMALALSLDKKLGDSVDIHGEQFEIVAIYDSYNPLEKGGAVVSLRDLQNLLRLSKKVTMFLISLQESHSHLDEVEELRRQIEALRTPGGLSYNIDVHPTREFSKKTK